MFDKPAKNVAIYGSGAKCEQLLSLYRQYVGEIAANIFFVDTYKESGGRFQGYPLYNVKDVGELDIDIAIIASNLYKEEMLTNIQEYCPKEINIKYIPDNLNFYRTI